MWRSAVLAKRACLSRLVANQTFHGLQNHAFVLAPLPSCESSFRYYSHWLSCLHETTRLFSSNPSQESESLVSEPIGNVNLEAVSSLADEGSTVFDGIGDNEFGDNKVVGDTVLGDNLEAVSSLADEGDNEFGDNKVVGDTVLGDNLEAVSSLADEGDNEFGDNKVVGDTVLGDNLEAVSSLADEGSNDFGDNKVVMEGDEKAEGDLEKMESLLSLLQSSGVVDGCIESSLDEIGLSLNKELVVKVLETPYIPGENLISFFKWILKKPEFLVTCRAVELLVNSVCIEGRNVYALWDLVKEIGEKEKGILSAEVLNELIALLSRLGKGKAAFEIFNKFGELGCTPNADTYYSTIEALSRRGIYDWASTVCEKMILAGMLPGVEKVGKIVSYLCKGNKPGDAHLVYLSAKEKNVSLPVSSMKLLISSLCRKDESVKLAIEMLDEFPKEERKHAIKSFANVINGLCRAKDSEDIKEAKNLVFKMIEAGPPPGNAVFNTVINALSKKGEMGEARKLLKVMENRGLKPDVYAYSVIMSAYAKGGEMEEACKILDEAKKKHSKLCPVTYHTIIRGYCKLEQYDKALELLGEMKEYGVQPNADEYTKFIQSLCLNALDWTTAEKLLEEMKENGLHLNAITKGLVRAVKELEQEEVGTTATA